MPAQPSRYLRALSDEWLVEDLVRAVERGKTEEAENMKAELLRRLRVAAEERLFKLARAIAGY